VVLLRVVAAVALELKREGIGMVSCRRSWRLSWVVRESAVHSASNPRSCWQRQSEETVVPDMVQWLLPRKPMVFLYSCLCR